MSVQKMFKNTFLKSKKRNKHILEHWLQVITSTHYNKHANC